jgi:outer membrane protein TolC
MSKFSWKTAAIVFSPALLGGCVTSDFLDTYAVNDAGFANVSAEVASTNGKKTVWVQNQHDATANAKRVHKLVHKRTINADTAVQVALLNNKGLQAAYADIGITAAQVWQEALPENPRVAIGVLGIGTPGLEAYRAIEGIIANNILRLATRDRRVDIADTRFRQAQKRAVLQTLQLASRTRNAWINAVGAFETVFYLNQAKASADAASELAEQLGKSGALTKSGQAREHVFYAELTGQRAEAKLAAKSAKEELTRLMGLWGQEVDYFVPDRLPKLPNRRKSNSHIERAALQNRVDIQIAKLELEALAKSYGLTDATKYLTDFEIIAGGELERELDAGEIEKVKTGQVEFEFVIPIFDTGKPRLRKAELAYMRAANQLAEMAVNARSEARSAYTEYNARYELARHYRNNVLPLRTTIEEEALLTYNGMITNTFELLADTRAKANAVLLSVNAKRNFWLADANLDGVVVAGAGGSVGGEAMVVADGGGAGH